MERMAAGAKHAFGPTPLSRLTQKIPCRERSTKRTFTFNLSFRKPKFDFLFYEIKRIFEIGEIGVYGIYTNCQRQ